MVFEICVQPFSFAAELILSLSPVAMVSRDPVLPVGEVGVCVRHCDGATQPEQELLPAIPADQLGVPATPDWRQSSLPRCYVPSVSARLPGWLLPAHTWQNAANSCQGTMLLLSVGDR